MTLEQVRDEVAKSQEYASKAADHALAATAAVRRGDSDRADLESRQALRCAQRAEIAAGYAIEIMKGVRR